VAPVPAARQRFPGLGPSGRALPPGPAHDSEGSVGERLWRRLAGHLGGQRWRLCALRLHAADDGRTLAASLSTLSSLGAPPRAASPAWKVPKARWRSTTAAVPTPHVVRRGIPGDLPLIRL
jgi:hypothetical protein